MHLLLTDRLVCVRCGPAFGLVLRADRMEDRRALEGGLGCPNCREVYPIRGGAGDLRPPPRTDLAEASLPEPGEDEVLRAQALLGVTEGPGEVVLAGTGARFAPALAHRVSGMEMVAIHPAVLAWGEEEGVSRLVAGSRLPFFDRGLRGVLMEGAVDRDLLREGARVLAPGHRIVVLEAPVGTADALLASGLTVQLDQEGVVVARR